QYASLLEDRSPVHRVRDAVVNYGKESLGYSVQGISSGYQFVENQYMVRGRYINTSDTEHTAKVVLISNKIMKEVFRDDEEPLGAYLDISGIRFQIVGVYGDHGGEREE